MHFSRFEDAQRMLEGISLGDVREFILARGGLHYGQSVRGVGTRSSAGASPRGSALATHARVDADAHPDDNTSTSSSTSMPQPPLIDRGAPSWHPSANEKPPRPPTLLVLAGIVECLARSPTIFPAEVGSPHTQKNLIS
jgi:hypothetical protein